MFKSLRYKLVHMNRMDDKDQSFFSRLTATHHEYQGMVSVTLNQSVAGGNQQTNSQKLFLAIYHPLF